MRRKGLGILFVLCLLLGALTLSMGAADPTGTPISTPDELISLMNGDATAWAQDYYLTQDIDLTGVSGQSPIGGTKTTANFTGTFDGQGYEIKGVNLLSSATGDVNWGLFGRVKGGTVRNLKVSGTVTAAGRRVAGIAGFSDGGTFENCVNKCTVTGGKAVAGIVGYSNGATTVSKCWNMGDITATAADGNGYIDVAAIVGLMGNTKATAETLSDCMNTGKITVADNAQASTKFGVGGIVGRNVAVCTLTNCYNGGEVVGGTAAEYASGKAIIGYFPAAKTLNASANYYKSGCGVGETITTGAGATADKCGAASVDFSTVTDPESCKTAFADLPVEDWTFTINGPELAVFHEHNWVNNVCSTCGISKSCEHAETVEVKDVPSTCSAPGTAHKVCKACGETVGESYALPLDANAHADFNYVWQTDGTNYYYTCADCGAVLHSQTEAPTLYVDAYTKASALVGNDRNDGLSKATALLTVEEAFRRLADVGGTVCFSDRYYVSSAIDFPANSKKITVTSDPKTGFYFEKSNLRVRIHGDVEFCNMFFYADKAANDAARLIVFVCNWHNVTFGEGLATSVSAYIFAGTESTADDTDAQTQDLIFFGVNQVVMTGTTGDNLSAARCFYDNIVLGSRTTATSVANVTANKEIQARFYDYTADPHVFSPKVGTLRCATTAQSANANVQGCETRVYLNGGTTVGKLAAGDKNMSTGAAALDKLLVALNGNTSTVTDTLCFFNVKQLVFSASHTLRTAAIPQRLVASFSEAYTADGTESLVASYGTHSFAADTGMADGLKAGVNYSAYYEGRVTVNLTDECTWTNTNANGTYAKTCSCGRTETVLSLAFGSATATSTGSTVRFIAEMTLGERAAVEKYGMLITALADQTAGSGSFADDKFAFAEGADVTAAADGKLRFAADLTGIPAGKGDTPIYAWAYVKLAGVDDLVILPFTPVTTNGLNTK